MDLFGDLPSAKSGQNDVKAPHDQSKGDSGASKSSAAAAGEANQSTPSAAPRQSTSLVESIGNAGTTFAFVPAALRRKKPAPTSAGGISGGGPGAKRPRTAQAQGAGLPSSQQQPQEDIGTKTSGTSSTTPPRLTRPPEGIQNQEPEWLRELHASVQPQDRYDPLVPNDYLAFRERQAHEQEQIRMERAAKEQLEVQRRVRERIEEERRAADEAGDLDRIVESRAVSVAASVGGAGRGMGRGRGTSNLPAWLVKKQQEENEKKTS